MTEILSPVRLSISVSHPGARRFEMFSLKGAMIASGNGRGAQTYTFDISRLPASMYVVRIVTPAESVNTTFMITGRN